MIVHVCYAISVSAILMDGIALAIVLWCVSSGVRMDGAYGRRLRLRIGWLVMGASWLAAVSPLLYSLGG